MTTEGGLARKTMGYADRITEATEEVKILTKRCSLCGWTMDTICPYCGKGSPIITNDTLKLPKSLVEMWFGDG